MKKDTKYKTFKLSDDYKLSDQAMASIMVALQQSIMEQADIVPILKSFKLANTVDGLVVKNPPTELFTEGAKDSLSPEVSIGETDMSNA